MLVKTAWQLNDIRKILNGSFMITYGNILVFKYRGTIGTLAPLKRISWSHTKMRIVSCLATLPMVSSVLGLQIQQRDA